jgi:Phage tail tube protein, GTA-gp10
MSADGSTTLLWADGEYKFRLRIKELRELQDKCDAGPAQIMMRLVQHTWRVDDILQSIRLGLIGGGASPTDALLLVKRYVEDRPLAENVVIAAEIVAAAISGDPKDDAAKKDQATEEATAEFPSPPSMEPAPSSAGLHAKSIN